MITHQEIELIAEAVAIKLKKLDDNFISMEEAAKYLGIRAKDKNLSATFTRLSNPKNHKTPLKSYYVGKRRTYKRSDLDLFMENRVRG